ncbi:MAG: helix-turn-helix domain-containing protein [Deltaproteobacteria bacterium]|nr:helix-turn-helix domain-containing protein [Deltaproteobacteria bacterium]
MRQLRYNGEELRRIRNSEGIELTAIAEITRISKRYLEYIEGDNYSYLPAIPYLKGYLGQYAICLKLDPDEVCICYLGYFMEWLNHRPSEKSSLEQREDVAMAR